MQLWLWASYVRLSQSGSIIILRDRASISGLTLSVTSRHGEERPNRGVQKGPCPQSGLSQPELRGRPFYCSSALNLPAEIVDMVAQKYVFSGELTEKHRIELAETIQFLHEEGLIRQRLAVQDLFVD